MPEEIPWNSSVFPEKASPPIPTKPGTLPILNRPQRGAPQGYTSTAEQSSRTTDITRQPTRPLHANQLPRGLNHPWPLSQPAPFSTRVTPRFPQAQLTRPAPQATPTRFPAPGQAAPPWLTRTMPRLASTPPFVPGQSRPLAQPARPAPTLARFTPFPSMPLPLPAWPAFQPTHTRFILPAPVPPPRFAAAAPVLPAQAGRMVPLVPAFARPREPGPALPSSFPRENRYLASAAPLPDSQAHLHLQISTSAWRRATHASQSKLLLASTLLFLMAMMIVLSLMGIHQQAQATGSISPLPYPPYQGTLVLNDPLHTNSSAWEVSRDGTGRCSFRASAYHVIAAQRSAFTSCRAQGLARTNFALQVKMTLLSGDRGGIVFRLNQTGGYFFSLNRAGNYSLTAFTGHKSTSLLNGSSSVIPPGQTYLLAVVAIDQQIELYVNQYKIAGIHDATFKGETIAPGAQEISQPTEVAFSDIMLWQL